MNGSPSNQASTSGGGELTGKLVQWDDAKGFGWVEHEGKQAFAHIKEFTTRQRRPRKGDEVIYRLGMDAQGRACAKGISLKVTGGRIGVGAWILLGVLLVLPLFSSEYLPVPKWVVPAWLIVASAIAWHLYRSDKDRAGQNQWRIPEAELHLISLLGGWPGAFLAQRRLRHKTRKPWFQFIFILTIALHQVAAVEVILGGAFSRRIWMEISEAIR
ncbi:DUF1294 domain-containing protein [Luteolibacter flavescens]|uniref:DUF1294 domain-containing protein n=1 Tax=Luteolibacter flavescens TaxID=1859460 RepID=A0ABT3FUZ9_9BACT|nr:DUF1294 domain-containing protein [Luteolibacter flavescens]MCW1887418.1 DUF1294 domain-containing protein [Luteolibacter flavescens]